MAAPTLPFARDATGQAVLATPVLPLDAAGNPLPAGGAVTIADGADVAEGAKADTAWSGSGAGSVVSILKALWAALTGTILVGGVVTDGVAPTSNAVRVSGIDGAGLKRTFLTDALGRFVPSVCIPYNDSTSVLTGAATFTGTARDSGTASGGAAGLGYFNAFFFADQIGTASIEGSWDNSAWTKLASAAVAVSTPLTLQVPLMFRYHRVKLVNGATLQTVLQIASSYTAS